MTETQREIQACFKCIQALSSRAPGVTLVKGDLRGILRARLLSRAVMRNIKQNLFFVFVY